MHLSAPACCRGAHQPRQQMTSLELTAVHSSPQQWQHVAAQHIGECIGARIAESLVTALHQLTTQGCDHKTPSRSSCAGAHSVLPLTTKGCDHKTPIRCITRHSAASGLAALHHSSHGCIDADLISQVERVVERVGADLGGRQCLAQLLHSVFAHGCHLTGTEAEHLQRRAVAQPLAQ